LAACETLTVESPEVCGGELVGVAEVAEVADVSLDVGTWLVSVLLSPGASAAVGDTNVADVVGEALAVAAADVVAGAALAGLGTAEVIGARSVVTGAGSDVTGTGSVVSGVAGAATRGEGRSALVTDGAAVVTGGATAVGAVVVWTTCGDGSGAWVWGGASTLGAAGSVTGAFGGASRTGASCTTGASAAFVGGADASGSGTATVVVGPEGSVSGFAYAGATPPVSAVREITRPDARVAKAVRFEHNSPGARMCIDSYYLTERGGFPPGCHAQTAPPTLDLDQQLPRLLVQVRSPKRRPAHSVDSSLIRRIRYSSRRPNSRGMPQILVSEKYTGCDQPGASWHGAASLL
jgi:hypothetical protein